MRKICQEKMLLAMFSYYSPYFAFTHLCNSYCSGELTFASCEEHSVKCLALSNFVERA